MTKCNADYTCKGLRGGAISLPFGPFWMLEGRGKSRARNDPDPRTMFAEKAKIELSVTQTAKKFPAYSEKQSKELNHYWTIQHNVHSRKPNNQKTRELNLYQIAYKLIDLKYN